MSNVKILVLTKTDSVNRQKNIIEQFEKINTPFEFFYGLDTKVIFDGLTAKETNCSLNHFIMAEYVRTTCKEVDFFVFLEDDVILDDDFLDILSKFQTISQKQKFDVLLLGIFIKSSEGDDVVLDNGTDSCVEDNHSYFYLPDYSQYYGAHGYCVPRESLLDLQIIRHHFKTHADAWSYFNRTSTLKILHMYPHVVKQDSNFISLIGEHSLMPF